LKLIGLAKIRIVKVNKIINFFKKFMKIGDIVEQLFCKLVGSGLATNGPVGAG